MNSATKIAVLMGGQQASTPAPPTPLPTMPVLAFSAVAAAQVDLLWSDSDTETGYRVYRSTDGTNYTQLGADLAAGSTSYSDTTTSADTRYYYRVGAFSGAGETLSNRMAAYYFSDNFARSDGEVANGWTGSTWTIASGKARNTPNMGTTVTANADFEGTFTSGSADSWVPTAAATKAEENTIVHSGSKSQKVSHTNVAGIVQDNRAFTSGRWYKASFWAYLETASATFEALVRDAGTNFFVSGNWNLTQNTWNNFIRYGKPKASGSTTSVIQAYMNTVSANVAYHDDYNIFPLTESELMLTRDTGMTDFDISIKLTLPVVANAKQPAGIIACVNDPANPTSYMEAYYGNDGKVHLDLMVNGASYPDLIATTTTYGAGKVLRLVKVGGYVGIFYDGTQKGATQTISYGALQNTTHGLFNLHPTNDLDDVVIAAPIGNGGLAAAATPTDNIFALGDSITVGANDITDGAWVTHLIERLATVTGSAWYEKPIRFAQGSMTTPQLAGLIDGALSARTDFPKYTVIFVGTNDRTTTEADFKTAYRYVLDAVIAKWPTTKIYMMDISGARIAGWIPALIAEHPTYLFDGGDFTTIFAGHPEYFTAPETVHPNHAGHMAMALGMATKMGY